MSASPMDKQELITRIKTHIAKGNLAVEKSEQHYIAAGQYLKSLKEQHEGSWAEWEELLKTEIGIGKSRASELMQIADGRKTVDDVHIATADRVRKSRKNQKGSFSVSSGEVAAIKGAKTTNSAAAAPASTATVPSRTVATPEAIAALDARLEAVTNEELDQLGNELARRKALEDEEIAKLRSEVQQLRKQVIGFESEIEELRKENAALKAKLVEQTGTYH